MKMGSGVEHGLWLRHSQGDRQVEAEIFANYMYIVNHTVLQLKRRLPRHIMSDDLQSAGLEGLWNAIRGYKVDRMVPFEPYARQRIRGAIIDELRKLDDLSRRQREQVKKAQTAYEVQAQVTAHIALDDNERLEWIVDDSVVLPEEAAIRSSETAVLNRALSKLSKQEQLVLSMVFVEGLNLAETAEVLELSRGRISAIHSGALKSLKGSLVRQGAGRSR